MTVTVLFMDPTRAARASEELGNPLKVKWGTPAIMQLTAGLKSVGAPPATLPETLPRAQFIVSPVVNPVTGKFAVPEVKVES